MTSTVNSCISNGNCITSVCVIINITQNQNPLCDAYFRLFKYLLTQKCTSTFKSSPKQFNCLIFLNEIKTIKCENQIKSQIGTKNNEFWCVFFFWFGFWFGFISMRYILARPTICTARTPFLNVATVVISKKQRNEVIKTENHKTNMRIC